MPGPARPTPWQSASCSHVGLVRRCNEDSVLDRPDLGLFVVADGMGGMTAGDLASQAIARSLGAMPSPRDAPALVAEINTRLAEVNGRLIALARARGPDITIGSTVAGLILHGGHFACFWAGDSRVYRLRRGELDQLTRDHSMVQDMVDRGLLAPGDAEKHPHASVILRAVGVDDVLQLEWVHAALQPGDRFLVCSDGLSRFVSDPEIERFATGTDLVGARDALLDLTLRRGAKDNVTMILVATPGEAAAMADETVLHRRASAG